MSFDLKVTGMKKLSLSKTKIIIGIVTLIFVGTIQAQSGTNSITTKIEMHHSHQMNHSDEANIIWESPIDLASIDKNGDGKVFQDQMEWNVISDVEGKCPLCGMTLKEVSLDEAKTNLLDNGFSVITADVNNTGTTTSEAVHNHSSMTKNNAVKTWNKYCLVTGKMISKSAETLEYDGKVIGFCCAGSKHHEVFLKDQEKYMKNLSSDGQKFIGEK